MDLSFIYPENYTTKNFPNQEELHACITSRDDFFNKFSYIYYDINLNKEKLSRLYKPRKRLTEIENGGILSEETKPDDIVCLDYYICRTKKVKKEKTLRNVTYDGDMYEEKRKNRIPEIGEKFILVGKNISDADIESANNLICTVEQVYPFIYRYDPKVNKNIKIRTEQSGVVVVSVDVRASKQKRSILYPPLIPKYRRFDPTII